MAKVFRLYKEGNNTLSGWCGSKLYPYNEKNRESIEDPDGASSKNEITSIPSPYARIELVKNAFKMVLKKGNKGKGFINMDGNSIHHKMVSDCFDVGEIFFNIDVYKDKFDIITCDISKVIDNLKDSANENHAYLADSLEKYLKADKNSYNFQHLQNLYILNYIKGPNEYNVVGATSPATLFFSTANNADYIDDVYFGLDKPFDGDFQPLYKRDKEYIKYWFYLKNNLPDFSKRFPEVCAYLEETFRVLNLEIKEEIREYSKTSKNIFSEIIVENEGRNDRVEVLGFPLAKRKVNLSETGEESDFVIKSKKEIIKKPLILPVEAGNKYNNLIYLTHKWGSENRVSYYDEAVLNERKLPYSGSKYPYLTISDFLEPALIEVPHALNAKEYYSGGINQNESIPRSYLLPLTKTFFDYFDVIDLQTPLEDNEPMLSMNTLAGGSVKVCLRIPIKGNETCRYMEYSRIYYKDSNKDLEANKGCIVQFDFTAFIMPNIVFQEPKSAIYNVGCIYTMDRERQEKYSLEFFTDTNSSIHKIHKVNRNRMFPNLPSALSYTIEGENIQYIKIADRFQNAGVIVPLFGQEKAHEDFIFSIDLGTSNTHIEYSTDGKTSTPFKYKFENELISLVFKQSFAEIEGKSIPMDLVEEKQTIDKLFYPETMGEDSDFYFPMRTILSRSADIEWNQELKPLGLTNVSFTYDKRRELDYNKIEFNIKWSNEENQARVLEMYIYNLILMIRNKVLVNNGKLSATKLVLTYPSSMPQNKISKLKRIWDTAFHYYFNSEKDTCWISESSAPAQLIFKQYAAATSVLNIDIGGGTTDIAFARNNEVEYSTSFRFGANDLFKNPYADANNKNGIVDFYKEKIKDLLVNLQDSDPQKYQLQEILELFESDSNSDPANMAAFLFSIRGLSVLKDVNKDSVDFNKKLQNDDDFRIVFLLFYTSIIYHTAQLLKTLSFDLPRYISFSGNGSKVLHIISTDNKILEDYTKLIFAKVTGKEYRLLNIVGLNDSYNPKTVTSKGAIFADENTDRAVKSVVLNTVENRLAKSTDSYEIMKTSSYQDAEIRCVLAFYRFFEQDLNGLYDFDAHFGMSRSILDLFRCSAKNDLLRFLQKGIQQEAFDASDDAMMGQTSFFLPIKGTINELCASIKAIKSQS